MLGMRKSRLAQAAVLALVISGLMLTGCSQKKQQQAGGAVAVKTMQVIKRDTPTVYDFTGFVEAQQEAKLTPQVSGRITGKYFKGGDYVEEGQVLFTIDQRSYQTTVLNAQAALLKSQSELDRLQRDAQRYTTLYEQSAVSKQTYDQAIASRDQAQAAVDVQKAVLENAQVGMADTEVKAPFSGRVNTSDLAVGNYVTTGNTLMATMSNTNPVRVKFSMSENEYLKLAQAHNDSGVASLENMTLVLSDGSTYAEKGTVDQVDKGVTEGTGTLTLKASFNNPNHLLLPGMFGRIQANAGTTKNAMLIPQRAVKELLYKKFVYTVDGDNKVDMKEVKMGARVGRMWLVESGLDGNETIVVEGIQKVNKGSLVEQTAITEKDLDTGDAK